VENSAQAVWVPRVFFLGGPQGSKWRRVNFCPKFPPVRFHWGGKFPFPRRSLRVFPPSFLERQELFPPQIVVPPLKPKSARIETREGYTQDSGLYSHGYLLAPAVVEKGLSFFIPSVNNDEPILPSIQFILVSIFILFEEIIWEGLANPIHTKIVSLNILVNLENIITLFNRYIILLLFTILLLGVEGVGILAGVFFVQGKITLGILLYLIKIPIAGFTFWLFKVTNRNS